MDHKGVAAAVLVLPRRPEANGSRMPARECDRARPGGQHGQAVCNAMINALKCLEKVYSRDYVTASEHTAECSKLITQIKVALRLVPMSIEEFVRQHRIQCPAALEQIRKDRPITVQDDKENQLKRIADIVELFITSLGQLKLNVRAVDELCPNLSELYSSINVMSSLPNDFDTKVKVKAWYDKLQAMAAHEELSEKLARQIKLEMETAYNAFQRYLRNT